MHPKNTLLHFNETGYLVQILTKMCHFWIVWETPYIFLISWNFLLSTTQYVNILLGESLSV